MKVGWKAGHSVLLLTRGGERVCFSLLERDLKATWLLGIHIRPLGYKSQLPLSWSIACSPPRVESQDFEAGRLTVAVACRLLTPSERGGGGTRVQGNAAGLHSLLRTESVLPPYRPQLPGEYSLTANVRRLTDLLPRLHPGLLRPSSQNM